MQSATKIAHATNIERTTKIPRTESKMSRRGETVQMCMYTKFRIPANVDTTLALCVFLFQFGHPNDGYIFGTQTRRPTKLLRPHSVNGLTGN